MVHASSPSRHRLARGEAPHQCPVAPLTTASPDKTGQSSLPRFRAGASGSYLFCVRTRFGDSAGDSTTSSMSSMKGGNSGNNGSDLDMGNILKPTFDTMTEECRKTFEAYYGNLEELFLSCCEVRQQGTVLKDTTPIVFNNPR
jgi:hypothetical protein